MNIEKVPSDLGFRMPAEWNPHRATQIHWPSNMETWPGERLEKAERVFVEIIKALHTHEPVQLFLEDRATCVKAITKLDAHDIDIDQLQIHIQPINDVWCRDCGPIFIQQETNRKTAVTDWEYNAWGEKYPPYENDNAIPRYVARHLNVPRYVPGIVLEGGSIDVNNRGDLLTTRSVLLNPNRNPDKSRNQIEAYLQNYLGVSNIIWLNKGLVGDDTDGHIDDLARFLNDDTILAMIAEDTSDINYQTLQDNLQQLKRAESADGSSFNIELLPMPKTNIEGKTVDGSEYVPASYANFYIANGVVLVPLYDESTDQVAMDLFEHYFPDRDIIGIKCNDLVWGQGSIHCVTQQWI